MARAGHYLRDTAFPIKEVAHRVGMPDLQAFNKAVHRAFGTSPTGLRQQALSRSAYQREGIHYG